MDCSIPGFPVLHYLPELAQTHACCVGDAILCILSSVAPLSSHLQSFPASGSFPMSQLFAAGGQSIGVSASTSVLPMNIHSWFILGLIGSMSLLFKGLSKVFSRTQFESINSLVLSLLNGPTLTSVHDYWKNHSFDYTDLCLQSNVSAFNMLSRFVIVFLPRSKCQGCSHHKQWFWNPRKESLSVFPLFPHLFGMKWWDWMPWSSYFECSILSQLFTLLFHFHQEAL